MPDLVIRNVRLDGADVAGDIVIRDGWIVSTSAAAPPDWNGAVVEGHGHLALPGFVDGHAHLDKTSWGCRGVRTARRRGLPG